MPLRDILLALLVVAIWGFNFVVIKLSMGAVPPLLQASMRFGLAAVPFVIFIRPPKTQWYWVVGFGMSLGVALYAALNSAIFLGMPAGLSSLVLQTQVLFTIFFAFIVLGERPRRVQFIGGAIAFVGIAVIGADRLEGALFGPFALTIIAAIVWGVANIIAKKAGRVDMLAFVIWSSLAAAPALFLLSLVFEGPDTVYNALVAMNFWTFGQIVFLAYPATLFGFWVWNGLLSRLPAATVTPFALLVPITGMLSGWLILGETIGWAEFVGGVLVIGGLAVTLIRIRVKV